MIDYEKLLKLEQDGLITIRKHPTLDLEICNYTSKAQYKKMWNEDTVRCRGLILDGEHNIIQEPLNKFFNLNETPETSIPNLPSDEPTVYEKLDGVLGILYSENDEVAIASRGSFTSEYAIWATEWMREKGYRVEDFRDGYTYCFEIIYSRSRIVVDYHGRTEMVLLAVINTVSRNEIDHRVEGERLGLSYAHSFGLTDISHIQQYLSEESSGIDEEGFVIKYGNGLRLKIKSEDYRNLHRTITGLSARMVWDELRQGKSLDGLISLIPDEYYDWVWRVESRLQNERSILASDAIDILIGSDKFEERKDRAKYIINACVGKPKGLSGMVFGLMDKRTSSVKEISWNMVKPSSDEIPVM